MPAVSANPHSSRSIKSIDTLVLLTVVFECAFLDAVNDAPLNYVRGRPAAS